MSFTHLHVHSEFSLLDGLSKIPKLLARAKKQKMKALALTDHGSMYGAVKFYLDAQEEGIKPIIGVEAYQAGRSRFDKVAGVDKDQFHLLLLAKDNTGYRNLMKLTTQAHLEGFYYKPRIDWELIKRYHKGLIATSSCLQGVIAQSYLNKDPAQAESYAKKMLDLFGDDFYLEVQHHIKIPEQQHVNDQVIKLSRKLGVPLVATNDVHYVDPEDAQAQDALLAIQTKKIITDQDRLTMLDSPDFYLKDTQEMLAAFPKHSDAIKNTNVIADKCNVEIPIGNWVLPNYPLPSNTSAEDHLKDLTLKNLKYRYPKATKEIKDRIAYELDTICTKGFATYFLIVQDFVNWSKKQGIRVGPGRGSAAGSLVSYILRITSIDPISHGLPFERFMNPQRPSPPDIDLDFADDRRDEVIQYVTDKYGKDKVAQIITFGTMEARGAIRDIGRVLGMPYSEPDKIAKLIPMGFSIEEALTSVFELQEFYKEEKYKQLLDLAKKVEGVSRHASTHAAGIVIADKDLTDYTPLQRESHGEKITTQYDMYSLDLNISEKAIGLLKIDFLGLRNLSILGKAIEYVKKTTGKTVDVSGIPLDDAPTFKTISSGETTGLFQLESAGMRRVAKNLQPSKFSDVTAMVALFRPGPMELINDFIERKNNPNKIKFPHPDLKEVLAETYGIAVYQEQCLEIANIMAGYSLGEADILRRAIGKKKRSIMAKEKAKFIAGTKKQKYSKAVAEKVWGYIERFAGYGFNKSHAASYAMIAYQTAYMKTHYPVEFMTAVLTAEAHNTDKITLAIEECKRMGIIILPPNINTSQTNFTIKPHPKSLNKQAILFGFSAIKNVGSAAIKAIIKARKKSKFASFTDFCHRVDNQKANKKVIDSLIKVGAMDSFGKRACLLVSMDEIRSQAQTAQKQRDSGQQSLFAENDSSDTASMKDQLPDIDELPTTEKLNFEKELLGFYLGEHPMAQALQNIGQAASHKLFEASESPIGSRITIGGIITKVRTIFTRKTNSEMAFVTLEDETGNLEIVVFPNLFADTKDILVSDQPILVSAKVDEKEETSSFIAEKIQPVTNDTKLAANAQLTIPRGTSRDVLTQISQLLKSSPGSSTLTLVIENGDHPKKITLPYSIDYNQDIQTKIKSLLNSSP